MGRLDGKVAMITGGIQGIGRGLVLRFLKEGAKVLYCSRNPANNAEMLPLLAAIPGGAENARFVQADVGIKDQVEHCIAATVETFGRIDIVIPNAQGIAPLKPILEKPDEDYAMTLATGYYQSLWAIQAAVPHMRRQNRENRGDGGRFVLLSSTWALMGQRFASDYNITKAAIESLARSAANELGPDRITVNSICPGADSFAFQVYASANPGLEAKICEQIPAGYMGDCERDIGNMVLGLCSRNGTFVTGQNFFVDGGTWASRLISEHEVGTDIHAGRHQTAVTA